MILEILIFIILTVLMRYLIPSIYWKLNYEIMTRKIPAEDHWPIIGTSLKYLKINNLEGFYKTLISHLNHCAESPDLICKIWFGPIPLIGISNPKYVKKILSNPDALDKSELYGILSIVLSGVFVKNGSEWRELRKPLNNIITKKMIESNLTVFHEKALIVCKSLEEPAKSGDIVDVKQLLVIYALQSLFVSFYGFNLGIKENFGVNPVKLFKNITKYVLLMMFKLPYCLNTSLALKTKLGKEFLNWSKKVWNISYQAIQMAVEQDKSGEEVNINQKTPTLYARLINEKALRENLSREEVGKLASDFLLAGFDTSSTILSSILMLLAMHPELQETVYQEQIDLLGADTDIAPDWLQLFELPILTRVIKETLRLFTAPLIARKLRNDIDLGEYKLPKGCSVAISIYGLHRNPNYWSHPNEFYPDHFLPEEEAERPKSVYIPFSGGPRICPGAHYAMTSMKILISILIRKYRFQTELKFEDLELKFGLMTEFSQGYKCRIIQRVINKNI